MKNLIGFFVPNAKPEEDVTVPVTPQPTRPVKSMVEIHFENRGMNLTYFNDRFDLHPGDMVYVSGKLAGILGTVVSVTTKFRIHSIDYEKVLAKLNLTIHGSFTSVLDKMVSVGTLAVTPGQFTTWITPPDDPEAEPDEIITGEGYTIDIHNIGDCPDLTDAIAERAIGYCRGGNVKYIAIDNGVGCAFIEGTKWYRVDFCISDDGILTDLYCDCPYPGLCKHEAAVAFTLRALLQQTEIEDISTFAALDQDLFWRLASRKKVVEL